MVCSLNDIHRIQFEMLKSVVEICERNNLTYFLAQGTLLGAVRHKGFIPWDDDIDIIMPIEDLKKLGEIFRKEAPDGLYFENSEAEFFCPYLWTKVRKDNTASMPARYKNMPVHWGICIDLFPYYSARSGFIGRCFTKFCFKVAKKMLGTFMTPYEKNAGLFNRFIAVLPANFRRNVAKACLKLIDIKKNDSEYVFALCKDGKFLRREWLLGEEKRLVFEDESFRVPSDYDAFLTEMFGDYMTPPPKSEQRGHDLKMGDIIWDCEKSYKEYI